MFIKFAFEFDVEIASFTIAPNSDQGPNNFDLEAYVNEDWENVASYQMDPWNTQGFNVPNGIRATRYKMVFKDGHTSDCCMQMRKVVFRGSNSTHAPSRFPTHIPSISRNLTFYSPDPYASKSHII